MKVHLKIFVTALLLAVSALWLSSCKKDPVPPTVTTAGVSAVTLTTATAGGNVTADGGAEVTSRGVCWNTSENPTIANNKTSDGTGTGSFTSSLTGLSPGTPYYVRAYATNAAGTTYGNQQSFTTSPVLLATVTTAGISTYNDITAVSGGEITNDGGGNITARGVCWSSATQTPTISDSKTEDGTGTGSFTSNLTNLQPGTIYWVRAYAVNSAGPNYGSPVSFTTLLAGQIRDVDGNIYNTVTIGTQIWMAENLKTTKYNDGTDIPLVPGTWYSLTTPAYCWYDNDQAANADPYGALYSYYAVETGKLCPAGWHVPSYYQEYQALIDYLGGNSVAGGKLKEKGTTHWQSPNTGASDDYGFTAVPGGIKMIEYFTGLGIEAGLWSSSVEATTARYLSLNYNYESAGYGGAVKRVGLSVRCLKD